MTQSITSLLGDLLHTLRGFISPSERLSEEERQILEILEETIDGTDSRIRLVSGYQWRLRDAVQTALDYSQRLVDMIPAAIEVSGRNFTHDPHVNAFFASTEHLHEVFSNSSEIREFIEDSSHRLLDESCALLCMHKSEKRRPGMEVRGDRVRRDVMQTAVNFSDHHVLSPSVTEDEAREGLLRCFYEGLVTSALQRISSQRQDRKILESRRSTLSSRLRHLQSYLRRSDVDPVKAAEKEREVSVLEGKLNEVEDQLARTLPMTPEYSLEQVHAILESPQDYIRVDQQTLKVTKLGVKTKDDDRPHNDLELTEVSIDGQEPRMVVLARFPHSEILPLQSTQLM